MSRVDLVNKNLFSQFQPKKNDSLENFVRHSLANTARVARITKIKQNSRLRKRKGQEGPREVRKFRKNRKSNILVTLAIFASECKIFL